MIQNKKAQSYFFVYIIVGIVLIFAFAVFVIPMAYISDEVLGELNKTDIVQDNIQAKGAIAQIKPFITPAFDQIVFFLLVAIFIASIAFAIFTDFHPVAIGVFVLVLIILIIIAGVFANAYSEVKEISTFSSKAAEFKFTGTMLGNKFPIFVAVLGVVCLLIILAKRGGTNPY